MLPRGGHLLFYWACGEGKEETRRIIVISAFIRFLLAHFVSKLLFEQEFNIEINRNVQ